MRLSAKTVNDELARLGYRAQLVKGGGYFYFTSGETEGWLDRTVPVRGLNMMTLKQWVAEFRRLRELNHQILGSVKGKGR